MTLLATIDPGARAEQFHRRQCITTVKQRRLVAMHEPHAAALETTVLAENWSGTIEFRSMVDGDMQNRLVERYRALSSRHLLAPQLSELSTDSVLLTTETIQSHIRIAVAMRTIFDGLGYRFAPEQIPNTVEYYRSRTSHGSTLSAVVHSWVLARGNREQALEYFWRVLASDVIDIQRGTTGEGIHLAAMAGSVDLLQRCFTGLEFRGGRIILDPLWPESPGKLEFPLRYRGHRLRLHISGRSAEVSADSGKTTSIDVECCGRVQQLKPGCRIRFT